MAERIGIREVVAAATRLVERQGEFTREDLAAELGVSLQVLSMPLRNAAQAGRIRASKSKGPTTYYTVASARSSPAPPHSSPSCSGRAR